MSEILIYEKKGRVACITLNRPDKLNALDLEIRQQLKEVFQEIELDDGIGCIFILGAGSSFCAGGDVKTMGGYQPGGGRKRLINMHKMIKTLSLSDKPSIAAVHGFAAGAGLSLALACDMRLASDNAKFIASFLNVGLAPDSGSFYFLPRIVGMAKAKEIVLRTQPIKAQEALSIGLVNHVYPDDCFFDKSFALAEDIASRPRLAVALSKTIINRSFEMSLDEALDFEAMAQDICFQSEEHIEGINAFKEKRKPLFNK